MTPKIFTEIFLQLSELNANENYTACDIYPNMGMCVTEVHNYEET